MKPPQKPMRGKRPARKPAQPAPQDGPASPIHTLMSRAEHLYHRGRFREAIRVCRELARLDPTNAMPEQMIEGCQRRLRERRAILIAVGVALAVLAGVAAAVYTFVRRSSIDPSPGPLRLQERASRVFRFSSPLGHHKRLEYRWELLDAEGRPVPPAEEGTLSHQPTSPWECTYTPPHNLARAAEGGRPVTRRLIATGVNAAGRQALRAEWTIEVADVPLPPRILSATPRPDETISIVAGTGSRTFRVEAADGDGGSDLTYEWLVGKQLLHKGTEPSWAYTPPADSVPPGMTGREVSWEPPLTLTCRVANRFGEPLPVTVRWGIRPVRANGPPRFHAFEPELSEAHLVREGEAQAIKVVVFDPDPGEVLSYRWELDGITISSRDTCSLKFPYTFTDTEKRVSLHLIVTDSCGERIERTWKLTIVNSPEPITPPSY